MPEAAEQEELTRIERWRRKRLREAGYDREAAQTLAICMDVDLHRALTLLRQGCPQELAIKILL
jgi:hypothetical protein